MCSTVNVFVKEFLLYKARRRLGSFFSLDRKETKNQGYVSFLTLGYPNFKGNRKRSR